MSILNCMSILNFMRVVQYCCSIYIIMKVGSVCGSAMWGGIYIYMDYAFVVVNVVVVVVEECMDVELLCVVGVCGCGCVGDRWMMMWTTKGVLVEWWFPQTNNNSFQ